MLMGEAREGQGATPAKDPSQVKEWFYVGPHIMAANPIAAYIAPLTMRTYLFRSTYAELGISAQLRDASRAKPSKQAI
jgi:hypothetical protein